MNKYLKYGLHAAVLIGIVIAGFKYLNGGDILEALRSFDHRYTPVMLLLTALYLLLTSWRFGFLMQPIVEAAWSVVMRAYAAGQAATLLPGGVAARAAILKQAGIPVSDSAGPILFSSLASQAVLLIVTLVAALWYPPARLPALITVGAIVVLAAPFLVPGVRVAVRKFTDRIARRFDSEETWRRSLHAARDIVNLRTLLVALGITALSVALTIAVLALAVQGVGASVPLSVLILAYVLPTIVGRLSGLPAGGVGVTEAGMVGLLTSLGGVSSGEAVAAVALFRITTVFFQALLGGAVYLLAWRGDAEHAAAGEAP